MSSNGHTFQNADERYGRKKSERDVGRKQKGQKVSELKQQVKK